MKAKDNFGRNALHYSVKSNSLALVNLLLSSLDDHYDPNEVDNDGHTPMSYCLKGCKSNG
jgi:ankyrin repeat protein